MGEKISSKQWVKRSHQKNLRKDQYAINFMVFLLFDLISLNSEQILTRVDNLQVMNTHVKLLNNRKW